METKTTDQVKGKIIYTCDTSVLLNYLKGLGLPVERCFPGHTGVIVEMSRELTDVEQSILDRVMIGPFGAYVVPETIHVTRLTVAHDVDKST